MMEEFDLGQLVEPALQWYKKNKRTLPWRMDQHPAAVPELLRIHGSHPLLLADGGELRLSCLPDSLLRGDGGFPADECLSRESLEVVLLHDGGDDLVIRHLRQVPHPTDGQPHLQPWRKARTLCGAESGKRGRSSGTHRHSPLRGHRLPYLSHHRDHHHREKGPQPYRIYI